MYMCITVSTAHIRTCRNTFSLKATTHDNAEERKGFARKLNISLLEYSQALSQEEIR